MGERFSEEMSGARGGRQSRGKEDVQQVGRNEEDKGRTMMAKSAVAHAHGARKFSLHRSIDFMIKYSSHSEL